MEVHQSRYLNLKYEEVFKWTILLRRPRQPRNSLLDTGGTFLTPQLSVTVCTPSVTHLSEYFNLYFRCSWCSYSAAPELNQLLLPRIKAREWWCRVRINHSHSDMPWQKSLRESIQRTRLGHKGWKVKSKGCCETFYNHKNTCFSCNSGNDYNVSGCVCVCVCVCVLSMLIWVWTAWVCNWVSALQSQSCSLRLLPARVLSIKTTESKNVWQCCEAAWDHGSCCLPCWTAASVDENNTGRKMFTDKIMH